MSSLKCKFYAYLGDMNVLINPIKRSGRLVSQFNCNCATVDHQKIPTQSRECSLAYGAIVNMKSTELKKTTY